jgi:hypothetical protein
VKFPGLLTTYSPPALERDEEGETFRLSRREVSGVTDRGLADSAQSHNGRGICEDVPKPLTIEDIEQTQATESQPFKAIMDAGRSKLPAILNRFFFRLRKRTQ